MHLHGTWFWLYRDVLTRAGRILDLPLLAGPLTGPGFFVDTPGPGSILNIEEFVT